MRPIGAFAGLLAMLGLLIGPAHARGAATPAEASLIRQAGCSLTDVVPARIYHADGYLIEGRLNMCSQSRPWLDVSTGAKAAKPGEILVFVYGRFVLGQKYDIRQKITFQRGRPNTPYVVRGDMAEAMYTSGTSSNASYNWKNAQKILPFMPTVVHDQGLLGGRRLYAYSGLRFLPGRAGAAYPLNSDSVILSIDGVSFNAPRAFSAPLEYPAPGQNYVEVIYFQKGDPDGPMRRAYIPLLPKSAAAADWDRMVDSNPIMQPNYSRQIAAAVIFTVLAKVIYDVSQSELGQELQRSYEKCRREGGIVC